MASESHHILFLRHIKSQNIDIKIMKTYRLGLTSESEVKIRNLLVFDILPNTSQCAAHPMSPVCSHGGTHSVTAARQKMCL